MINKEGRAASSYGIGGGVGARASIVLCSWCFPECFKDGALRTMAIMHGRWVPSLALWWGCEKQGRLYRQSEHFLTMSHSAFWELKKIIISPNLRQRLGNGDSWITRLGEDRTQGKNVHRALQYAGAVKTLWYHQSKVICSMEWKNPPKTWNFGRHALLGRGAQFKPSQASKETSLCVRHTFAIWI